MEHIEIEGKRYEIKGRDHMGTPIIQGHATTIHHKDEQGSPIFDEDGNPKISVHVSVSPQAEPITPEEE